MATTSSISLSSKEIAMTSTTELDSTGEGGGAGGGDFGDEGRGPDSDGNLTLTS